MSNDFSNYLQKLFIIVKLLFMVKVL